jgi:hypothetical protein
MIKIEKVTMIDIMTIKVIKQKEEMINKMFHNNNM